MGAGTGFESWRGESGALSAYSPPVVLQPPVYVLTVRARAFSRIENLASLWVKRKRKKRRERDRRWRTYSLFVLVGPGWVVRVLDTLVLLRQGRLSNMD